VYDTLHITLKHVDTDFVSLFDYDNGLNWSHGVSEQGFEYKVAYHKNFRIRVNVSTIKIQGSLAKYYLGTNIHTLRFEDIEPAIKQLGNELNLPIQRGELNRIDFSTVFIVKHPPSTYYSKLSFHNTMRERTLIGNSLYFENNSRQMVFYDKIKELENKSIPIPKEYVGKNALRYEIRFTGNLKRAFGQVVRVADLYDKTFFKDLYKRYKQMYKEIIKTNLASRNYSNTRDYGERLKARDIEREGIHKCIEEINSSTILKKDRTRAMVKNINKRGTTHPLIKELNKKILYL